MNNLDANAFSKIMSDLKKGDSSQADFLTAQKNLVSAVNNLATTYQQVNGILNQANLSGEDPILIKSSTARLSSVSVIEAGSSSGYIYDSKTTNIVNDTPKLYVIPNTVGVYVVNMPASFGLVVQPGTDQVITISYS